MKRILWLPIEVQKRELLGAEVLIQEALNRGFTVIVGEQNSSVFRFCRGGIVLHKDWAPWSYELIRSWKANNVKVALFDIEGLLFKSESDYIHRRVCTQALNDADLLFFWGRSRFEMLKGLVEGHEKCHLSGALSFDALKGGYKNTTQAPRKRILINTRFSSIHGLRGDKEESNLRDLGILKSNEDVEEFRLLCEAEHQIFNEFEKLFQLLSRNDNFDVRVRIHPAESREYYSKLARQYNFKISSNLNLIDDFNWANIMIHDACTTAIEACCFGLPVLGLRPDELVYPVYDYSNKFSLNFTSANDVMKYLETSKYTTLNLSNLNNHDIHNFAADSPTAAEIMVNQFDQLDIEKFSLVKAFILVAFDLKSILHVLLKIPLVSKFLPNKTRARLTIAQKFPVHMNRKNDLNKHRRVYSSRFLAIYK